MSQVSLVVMGAGESSRFRQGLSIKKQWLRLGETPLWKHVALHLSKQACFDQVIIAASPKEVKYMQKQVDFKVIEGGGTRQESLQNALARVKTPWVLVSDVARFDVPSEVISRVMGRLGEAECVAPAIGVSDTVSYQGEYLSRSEVKLIQTPQLSHVESLLLAFGQGDFTDESSAIAKSGGRVLLVEGSERLKKLTHSYELTLLQGFEPPFGGSYGGSGFDVHAFMEGEGLRLAGVDIPAPVAFKAHSDGDVAIHALIDALLGAVGAGDIGEWFPDSDLAYKGVDSTLLLQEVIKFIRGIGFELINADLTIMAQAPKLSPYKEAMERRLGEVMEVSRQRISVKATTTESLGFVGRKEGVAVSAQVVLKLLDWTKHACFNR